jgi:dipeptidyl aminopeptidase/acylaminoacyl peptidase
MLRNPTSFSAGVQNACLSGDGSCAAATARARARVAKQSAIGATRSISLVIFLGLPVCAWDAGACAVLLEVSMRWLRTARQHECRPRDKIRSRDGFFEERAARRHGLPAIVLPHGGPSARDEWGFDWLSQFYASRGFAVLQPNFRGSAGYGDAWFEKNGFRSWELAIGDVLAAGRWLVSEGIADPAKLSIVGWSYGGYAALLSAVVDPTLFKAVVAIAPVTDLETLKQESGSSFSFGHSGHEFVTDFVGTGPHVREGSPAQRADRIKVPVLLFHGGLDRNVSISQSQTMCSRLTAAGGKCELVTWEELDHQLDDSSARTQMLRRSEEFLRAAIGN